MAELSQGGDEAGSPSTGGSAAERPFPPGEYPVVVVGSGPGAIQVSYSLRRHGVGHAVVSADPAPGGMFRRWPFFQRLLSWTKPFAPVEQIKLVTDSGAPTALIEVTMGRPQAETLAKRISGRLYKGKPLNAWVPAMDW